MSNRKVCQTGKYVKQESKKYSSPSRMLSYFPDMYGIRRVVPRTLRDES